MNESIVYRCLSYVWRNTWLKWYRNGKKQKEERYWQEHRKSHGKENPDKTFYVIRRRDLYCGLFSLFLTNLQRIDDAVKQGYIPVIDMQSDFNIYLSEDKIGKENAWEYYFNQPMGYSLQDIKKSKNVIIGSGAVPPMFPYLDIKFLTGETGELEYWRRIAKQYICLNDNTSDYVEQKYKELFRKNERVLGILCRGTDYTSGKPKNHPIQPTIEQALDKAKEILIQQSCDRIFLATEDEEYYKAFVNEFKDKLFSVQNSYHKYQGGAFGKEIYGEINEQQNGLRYLTTIMLLSKCQCLCAGCTSGTVGALLLTEGYEYTYLFDLGIYE